MLFCFHFGCRPSSSAIHSRTFSLLFREWLAGGKQTNKQTLDFYILESSDDDDEEEEERKHLFMVIKWERVRAGQGTTNNVIFPGGDPSIITRRWDNYSIVVNPLLCVKPHGPSQG